MRAVSKETHRCILHAVLLCPIHSWVLKKKQGKEPSGRTKHREYEIKHKQPVTRTRVRTPRAYLCPYLQLCGNSLTHHWNAWIKRESKKWETEEYGNATIGSPTGESYWALDTFPKMRWGTGTFTLHESTRNPHLVLVGWLVGWCLVFSCLCLEVCGLWTNIGIDVQGRAFFFLLSSLFCTFAFLPWEGSACLQLHVFMYVCRMVYFFISEPALFCPVLSFRFLPMEQLLDSKKAATPGYTNVGQKSTHHEWFQFQKQGPHTHIQIHTQTHTIRERQADRQTGRQSDGERESQYAVF